MADFIKPCIILRPGAERDQETLSVGEMFYGSHPRMQEIHELASKVGGSDAPVLIQGETGTGKEVLARQLHALSVGIDKPFVKLNCAAVPSELMESELFGYERGAFTGAFKSKPGVFEMANGGTILLDEIGDMDIRLQAKLLQVLQDHEFRRVGSNVSVRVKFRVIAATHRNLEQAISKGNFREDLYYRLSVFTFSIPALRERKKDIIAMTEFLIDRYMKQGLPPIDLTPELERALIAHDWPGNVRELENTVRKLMVLRDPAVVTNDLCEKVTRMSPRSETLLAPAFTAETMTTLERVSQAKQQAEATAILAALNSTGWNRKKAAELLSVKYKALLYKMRKLSIEVKVGVAA